MNKGLKISNQKSNVAPPSNSQSELFQKAAQEAADRLTEYKKRSWDLGVKFKGLIESSILQENKSTILKDLEVEILTQLSQLANDINNDETQPEGTGGLAISQLLMKTILIQRDIINQAKFDIELLKKSVAELTLKIK